MQRGAGAWCVLGNEQQSGRRLDGRAAHAAASLPPPDLCSSTAAMKAARTSGFWPGRAGDTAGETHLMHAGHKTPPCKPARGAP